MPQDHETQNRDSLLPARWTHMWSFNPEPRVDARVVLYLDGVRYNRDTA